MTMNATTMTENRWESCVEDTPLAPSPPARTQMIVPRGIKIYPSLLERRFLTIVSATTTTMKKTIKLHKWHSANDTPLTPTPFARRQMIVPIYIATYPSLPERQFLTTMRATRTMTNKRIKPHKWYSAKDTPTTPAPPAGRQMIVPRGITTYPSIPDRILPTTVSATTITTNKTKSRGRGHFGCRL